MCLQAMFFFTRKCSSPIWLQTSLHQHYTRVKLLIMTSVISNRDRDCFACRMTSGCGLLGISAYLAYHGKLNPTPAGRFTILSIAATFTGLGVARLGNLWPFAKSLERNEAMHEET